MIRLKQDFIGISPKVVHYWLLQLTRTYLGVNRHIFKNHQVSLADILQHSNSPAEIDIKHQFVCK